MRTNQSVLALAVTLSLLTAAAQPQAPPMRERPRHVEGDLLVKFEGGPRGPAAERARATMRHTVTRDFDLIGWQHVRLPHGMTVEQGLARYRNLPGVQGVEPNGIIERDLPAAERTRWHPRFRRRIGARAAQ